MTRLSFVRAGFEGSQRWLRGEGPSAVTVLNGRAVGGGLAEPDGAFSVKWIPQGQTVYRVGGATHRLARGTSLFLNPGQPYELEFPDRIRSETLCVFYSDDLVAGAWRALSRPDAIEPDDLQPRLPEFPQLAAPLAGGLSTMLTQLRAGFDAPDPSAAVSEERLMLLLLHLVEAAEEQRLRAGAIDAVRPATRARLLERLMRARRLIEESFPGPLPLDRLAKAVGLSRFHLLRAFTAAFGATPSAYLGQLRMSRATELLHRTSWPLDRIAAEVGYESATTLIRAFRRRAGLTPGALRERIRNPG